MATYLNVTNTYNSRSRSGIQRVVRELVARLARGVDLTLVAWYRDSFYELSSERELDALLRGSIVDLRTAVNIGALTKGDIFLDIDASWGDPYDIRQLFAMLKSQGVVIVKLHYDAVPILLPALSHPNTVFQFTENFAASLQYSDYWMCISSTVLDDLQKIAESSGVGCPTSRVVPLGADFNDVRTARNLNRLPLAKLGEYMLCVGTLEPRKNYAMVVDLWEKLRLPGQEISLVIVGKQGWNTTELAERIRSHPLLGIRLFWFDHANDDEITTLYKNASLTLNLSHYEGYGLPVVESLNHGCVTVCSEGGAMEEVSRGAAYCVTPTLDDARRALELLFQPETMRDYKQRAENFVAPLWSDTAVHIGDFVNELKDGLDLSHSPKQAVYISIRPESLYRSLVSIAQHMTFIDRVMILTSSDQYQFMVEKLKTISLELTIVIEGDLGLRNLPKDHQTRNTLLRRKLYSHDAIEENFIAFDDDYLVLSHIEASDFIQNGVHKAYYFFEQGEHWLGTYYKGTSFDRGLWRTVRYLRSCGYDSKLYNSHMPQIVNKRLAVQIFERTKGLGLDEWSSYFNIAKHLQHASFEDRVYRTMGWPDIGAPWLPTSMPQNIAFLNSLEQYTPNQLDSAHRINKAIRIWVEKTQTNYLLQHSIEPKYPLLTVLPNELSTNFDTLTCKKGAIICLRMAIDATRFSLTVSYGNEVLEFEEEDVPLWVRIPTKALKSSRSPTLSMKLHIHEPPYICEKSVPLSIE